MLLLSIRRTQQEQRRMKMSQGNNKVGQRVYGKAMGNKEIDGMNRARRPSTKRKRKAHKKAIETRVRQANKKACRDY